MTTDPLTPSNGDGQHKRRRTILFGTLAGILLVGGGIYFAELLSANHLDVAVVAHQTTATSTVLIPTTTTPPPIGTGYLAIGTTFVDFIQWNNSNGSLNGSEQTVNTTGQTPNMSTTSGTLQVTGVLHGSSISLSFEGFNGGAPVFGTAAGTSVVMNFPQPDGTLAPVTFLKAGVAQFNNAVVQLKNTIQAANESAIQAANQAALQAAQEAKAAKEKELSSIATTGTLIGTVHNNYSTPGASDMGEFTFGKLPLAICYKVSGSSVGTLSYEIGGLLRSVQTAVTVVPLNEVHKSGSDS